MVVWWLCGGGRLARQLCRLARNSRFATEPTVLGWYCHQPSSHGILQHVNDPLSQAFVVAKHLQNVP
jgi:hypothetical protein